MVSSRWFSGHAVQVITPAILAEANRQSTASTMDADRAAKDYLFKYISIVSFIVL
jgi:hypothetical protein